MTAADAEDAAPVLTALLAVTLNVYAVPLVSPVTVAVNAPAVVAVKLPGVDVTVYPMIGEPPLDDGATQLTVACPLPPTAATLVGAPGGAAGVTAAEDAEPALVPIAFLAVTTNV